MSYSVSCCLTDAEKIKHLFGSKDISLFEKLAADLEDELEELDNYFEDDIDGAKISKSILRDLVINAEIRFPEYAFLYGYVYEKLCKYYGERVFPPNDFADYSTAYFGEVSDGHSTFIDIPAPDDFPGILSIALENLSTEREKFLQLEKIDGVDDEEVQLSKEDFRYLFDKAIAEKKSIVFFVY